MAKFKWDSDGTEREFEYVDGLQFLGAEARWVEKQFGANLPDLTWSETLFARALVTLRRNNIMLTLADTDDWTVGFINDRVDFGDEADSDDGLDPHEPAEDLSSDSGGSAGLTSSSITDSTPETPSD